MSPGPPVCFIVEAGGALASRLAAPLSQSGYAVGLIDSRADLDAAFDQAVVRCGTPQLVILSMIPTSLMVKCDIDDMSAELWTDDLPAATIATLQALQSCHRQLQATGGTIVMVGPAVSLVGAPGATALCTLLEAQRTLVKSAARQWGRLGIRVHWIALGAAGNYPGLDSHLIPQVPELGPPPPALGRVPDVDHDIAPLLVFIGSAGAAALTGATLVADGGNWMVP